MDSGITFLKRLRSRAHYYPRIINTCNYNRFVAGTWDEEIWEEISVLLRNDVGWTSNWQSFPLKV
jgi:hypothetical protein